MQKCNKCQEVKPFNEFHKNHNMKLGYVKICKACVKIYKANYVKPENIQLVEIDYSKLQKYILYKTKDKDRSGRTEIKYSKEEDYKTDNEILMELYDIEDVLMYQERWTDYYKLAIHLYHLDTKEEFFGLKKEFFKKHPEISKPILYLLISEKSATTKNWCLFKNKDKLKRWGNKRWILI